MRLSQINVYPIKSCAQVRLSASLVERRGLLRDRRFMLVDPKGRFMSQRAFPRMALIHITLFDEGLMVQAPEQQSLYLPLALEGAERVEVTVWDDRVRAVAADAQVDEWFSDFLGRPSRLVYMPDDHLRPVRPDRAQEGDQLSFADGAPLLLISDASLADLNARLNEPVEMRRFRPNLVVTANTAFEEDTWKRIAIGEAEFDVSWACTRCVLTTVDPETGQRNADREPLRTLKTFRQTDEGTAFGQNLIPRALGCIQINDEVRVLETA